MFTERFVRAVGEGEQAGAHEWWGYQLRGCCRGGLGSTHVARASGCSYGGAAAMLDDVMRVQWEVEVYCARVT